jgi:hypothetical protein
MEAMSAGAAPPETAASHEAREVLFAPPLYDCLAPAVYIGSARPGRLLEFACRKSRASVEYSAQIRSIQTIRLGRYVAQSILHVYVGRTPTID